MQEYTIEKHPLSPFLPANAKILMLGSFPPLKTRWSMNFFYPNFNNDMWRIMGLIYYGNLDIFVLAKDKRFNYELVRNFSNEKGIALYDTACEVRRLNNDSSDKFLEILKNSDIALLLSSIPCCKAIVTTGQKATETLAGYAGTDIPEIGKKVIVKIGKKEYDFYRMPSSSRAYPLKIEKKAEYYKQMFKELDML